MDDAIRTKLLGLGWKENTRYPDTSRWQFFEIRTFNYLRVVCVIEKGLSSANEVWEIKTYLNQRMPWFTLNDMGLVFVFSETRRYTDLAGCLSKYASKIVIQKIIQFTPEKVYEQNTWVTGIVDRCLGDFVSEIAGTREVLRSKIDGGWVRGILMNKWLRYATYLLALLGISLLFMK